MLALRRPINCYMESEDDELLGLQSHSAGEKSHVGMAITVMLAVG